MKFTLEIEDNMTSFFMELIGNLDFVKVSPQSSKEAILSELRQSLIEAKQIEKGELPAKSLKDFLNEL